MKKLYGTMLYLFAAVLASSTLAGCALFDEEKSLTAPNMWSRIDKTREDSAKLRIGMTKPEVKDIMGDPLKELYSTDDVWFYYARTKWSDGMVTRDETLPVVFDKNGFLIGWGVKFFTDNYGFTGWTDKAIEEILK